MEIYIYSHKNHLTISIIIEPVTIATVTTVNTDVSEIMTSSVMYNANVTTSIDADTIATVTTATANTVTSTILMMTPPDASNDKQTDNNDSSSSIVIVIIGCVVGVVVCIVIMTAIVLLLWYKRKRIHKDANSVGELFYIILFPIWYFP